MTKPDSTPARNNNPKYPDYGSQATPTKPNTQGDIPLGTHVDIILEKLEKLETGEIQDKGIYVKAKTVNWILDATKRLMLTHGIARYDASLSPYVSEEDAKKIEALFTRLEKSPVKEVREGFSTHQNQVDSTLKVRLFCANRGWNPDEKSREPKKDKKNGDDLHFTIRRARETNPRL
ncbi:MAG: hypothetical protein A3F10_04925 [Coxiella sp. RIFCSPHIGHO2_12_FULL_42_15]|nr:MAG: hypothetical protein A3F10_04925 [Coxiella sp. RIFCSPHIGHO2_12_FULL_42_15]